MMRRFGAFAVTLVFVLCSGFVCTGSQIHKLRIADADLASALNHGAQEVIALKAQGTISQAEESSALGRIDDATVLSDKVTGCLNSVTGGASPAACITPLLQGVQADMNDLGIKSQGAQAIVSSIIGGVTAIFSEFTAGGVAQ
jgi:hypothetical protein